MLSQYKMKSNFIFEKEKNFIKNQLSPIALMKGFSGLNLSKSRNSINLISINS